MLPKSTQRVSDHTDPAVNAKIQMEIAMSVLCHWAGGREAINERLEELDGEWDVERAIEANASSILLIGFTLGIFVNSIWLILPLLVAAFLLQHALQGWCPPVPVLRWLGYRTTQEIDQERYALKVLRGDFEEAPAYSEPCDGERVAKLMASVRSGGCCS